MGLLVHSLNGIPEEHHRDYFIYLLDFGWNEPLSEALRNNFNQMATLASKKKNAVVIMGTDSGIHFSDEVLSWHSINGYDADRDQLLPAILVTNRHPSEFRKRAVHDNSKAENDLKMILFPLKKYCKDTTEVISLIQKIFTLINEEKDLDDFKVVKEKKKVIGGAIANSIIVEPKIGGIGFSFNKFIQYLKEKS